MKAWRESLVVMVLALALASPVYASDDYKHVIATESTATGSVTRAEMDDRLRKGARRDEQYGHAIRAVYYDMASPADREEYLATGGYALMWVVVIVDDASELPLKRVYLKTAKGEVSLIRVSSRRRPMEIEDKIVQQVYGTHRQDALYYVPITADIQGAKVVADFTRNRVGFVVGALGELSASLGGPVIKPAEVANPAAMKALQRREYPDFFVRRP